MNAFIRETCPTARKSHACSLCNGRIMPGEQYTRTTNVYDGRIGDFLRCTGCKDGMVLSRVYAWAFEPDEGVGFDDAMEWAREHAEHGTDDSKAAAKNYLDRYHASRGDDG